MAKAINTKLLQAMADSDQGFVYISPAEGKPLVHNDPQLIEVNPSVTDPNDPSKVAARLTDAGREYLNSISTHVSVSKESSKMSDYEIITNATPPASKRGNAKGGGAPTQYPFDKLEVGQSFLVPVSEKHPNPVKTLGSTVSSANNRYAEETGETVRKEVTKRGAGNKAVLDADGNKVREVVDRPVKRFTRRFVIREVEAGKSYGDYHAKANGALISRVE